MAATCRWLPAAQGPGCVCADLHRAPCRAHNRRMSVPRTSLPPSLQSFGDISRFLREGVADEDSRQLRDSLSVLSGLIEEAVRARRSSTDAAVILRAATQLFQNAREHQLLLTGLGSAWHGLYEFDAYQRALWELRSAISAWKQALEQRSSGEAACFDRFELLAWRTLGEALLLIDMYEHDGRADTTTDDASTASRPASWWDRLRRRWLGSRG